MMTIQGIAGMPVWPVHCTVSIHCWLDYCSAPLAGTANIVIKQLQSIQNTTARLVSGTRLQDCIIIIRSLHWLQISQRIISKTIILPLPIWLCIVVKNVQSCPWLQASTGYPLAMSTDINRTAQCCILWTRSVEESTICAVQVACHWTGSNGSWKIIFFVSNEYHPWHFCNSGAAYKCHNLQSQVLPCWIQRIKFSSVYLLHVILTLSYDEIFVPITSVCEPRIAR